MPAEAEVQEPFVVGGFGVRGVIDHTVPRMAILYRDRPDYLDYRDEDSPQSRCCQRIIEQHPGHPRPASKISTAFEIFADDLITPPATDPYQPVVQEFIICGLPDGHELWDSFAVKIYNRGAGWWSVKRLTRLVTVDGREVPPNRDDCPEDTPDLFMDVNTALRVATRHARTFRLRGRSAADIVAADQAAAAATN